MSHEPDDLAALWQSAAAGRSTDELLAYVDSEEQSHRHLKWFFIAVTVVVTCSVAYIELTGAIKVPGIVAAIAFGATWVHWNQYHARRKSAQEIATLSPKAMLEHALNDATQNLSLARGMHTLFPGGALFGYLSAPLITRERPWYEPPEWLDSTLIAIIVVTLAVCVIAGHWIARNAKRRIRVLQARLEEYDDAV